MTLLGVTAVCTVACTACIILCLNWLTLFSIYTRCICVYVRLSHSLVQDTVILFSQFAFMISFLKVKSFKERGLYIADYDKLAGRRADGLPILRSLLSSFPLSISCAP